MNAINMEKMTDIIVRLGEIGDWVSDKEWHQNPIAAEAQRAIQTLRANHKSVVETKRGANARLKAALAALQQIYDVCGDNDTDTCDHRMALRFVRDVACNAFEQATTNVRREKWDAAHTRPNGNTP